MTSRNDPFPTQQPCPTDPTDATLLRKARAAERCSHVKTADLYSDMGLTAANFLETGDRYNHYGKVADAANP